MAPLDLGLMCCPLKWTLANKIIKNIEKYFNMCSIYLSLTLNNKLYDWISSKSNTELNFLNNQLISFRRTVVVYNIYACTVFLYWFFLLKICDTIDFVCSLACIYYTNCNYWELFFYYLLLNLRTIMTVTQSKNCTNSNLDQTTECN